MRTTFRTVLDLLEQALDSGIDPRDLDRTKMLIERIRGLLDRSEARDGQSPLSLLRDLLEGCTTISTSGLDITIACDNFDTRDIVLGFLVDSC